MEGVDRKLEFEGAWEARGSFMSSKNRAANDFRASIESSLMRTALGAINKFSMLPALDEGVISTPGAGVLQEDVPSATFGAVSEISDELGAKASLESTFLVGAVIGAAMIPRKLFETFPPTRCRGGGGGGREAGDAKSTPPTPQASLTAWGVEQSPPCSTGVMELGGEVEVVIGDTRELIPVVAVMGEMEETPGCPPSETTSFRLTGEERLEEGMEEL